MRRLRIGWMTPAVKAGAGSPSMGVYFTREILPRLAHRFDFTIFQDSFSDFDGLPACHYLRLIEKHRSDPFDIILYQVENRPLANFIRAAIGILPSVTLFHDFLLSVDGPAPYVSSPWAETIQRLNGRQLPWFSRSNKDLRKGPHAFREAGYSPVCIFSDQRSKAEYLAHVDNAVGEDGRASVPHSYYLPFPVSPFTLEASGATQELLAYCGTPNIENRGHKLLQAVGALRDMVSMVWLIDDRERSQAEELLREFDISNVRLVCGRSPSKWREIVASARIAFHPVFSAFGNGEAYLPISLMAGAPVIGIKYGAIDCFPDEVVLKIDAGYSEVESYKRAIVELLRVPRGEAAAAGKRYAEEFHNSDLVAFELSTIFMREADYVRSAMAHWEEMQSAARTELLRESLSLLPGAEEGGDLGAKSVVSQSLSGLIGG